MGLLDSDLAPMLGGLLSSGWSRFRGVDPATGEADYWKRGGLAGLLGMPSWDEQPKTDIAMGFAGATTPAVKGLLKIGNRSLPIKRSPDDPFEYADSYSNFARPGGNRIMPLSELTPQGVSAHPTEQARVKSLMDKMSGPDGYVSRLLVDDAGHVIEGQHRYEALRQMGATDVPVTVIEDLGRNAPIDRMMEAAKAAGVPYQQRSQAVRQALEAIKDSGGAAKALQENQWPGQWHGIFEKIIGAVGDY